MANFYEISEDTEKMFFDIFKSKSFPMDIGFQFLGSEKQKNLIKITKIPDQYVHILGKEILVTINDDLVSLFDDEDVLILMEQEIDKISMNIDTGKIKFVKQDLITFSGIVKKYGIEKVSKANHVEELYAEQKQDSEKNNNEQKVEFQF